MVRSGFRYAAPRKDHARLGTLNFLTDIVKLPDFDPTLDGVSEFKIRKQRRRSSELSMPGAKAHTHQTRNKYARGQCGDRLGEFWGWGCPSLASVAMARQRCDNDAAPHDQTKIKQRENK